MICTVVRADTVVYYSFNQTNNIADVGSDLSAFSSANLAFVGSSTSNDVTSAFSFLTGTAVNSTSGYIAGRDAGNAGWMNSLGYWQLTLTASSLSNVVVSFALRGTGTGPTNLLFQYSTDGPAGTYTTFATLSSFNDGSYHAFTNDLSSVLAINNNPEVVFKLVGTGATASTGNLRIDNLTISAQVIPEPSTIMLVGAGLMGLFFVRQRRS